MNAQHNEDNSDWRTHQFNTTGDNWDEVEGVYSQKNAHQVDLIETIKKQLRHDKYGGVYMHQKIELGILPEEPNKAPGKALLSIQEKFFLELQHQELIQSFQMTTENEERYDTVWDIVYAEFDCYPERLASTLVEKVKEIKQKLNQTNQGGEIIKLADHDVIFNENESVILVGDRKCELPFSGNEFYLAKVLFSKQPRCPIDWSYVSKEMTGIDPLESRKNQKKLKRSVYDAVLAINDRIKKNIGTTDDLFTFKAKTVTRNY